MAQPGLFRAEFIRTGGGVVGWLLLTGVGNLDVSLPDIFTQPWRGLSMFSLRALAVALDAPQLFSCFTCV